MGSEKKDHLQSFLIGEVLMCGLLSRALYADPDKVWLEQLIQEDLFSELPLNSEQAALELGREILAHWVKSHPNGLMDEECQDLRNDQFSLFAGVGKVRAPAWESMYLSREHLIFQEQTLQVRHWYARYGLQFERLNKEPDDHIGVELSFVAHLASLALQALEAGDQAKLDMLLQNQRDFLSEHLLRWAPTWANLVQLHARTDFYRGIAWLTQGVLLAIAQELDIELPEEAIAEPACSCRTDCVSKA